MCLLYTYYKEDVVVIENTYKLFNDETELQQDMLTTLAVNMLTLQNSDGRCFILPISFTVNN